jgi:hypothetical protein
MAMRTAVPIVCLLAAIAASHPAAAVDDDCGLVPSTVGRDSDPFASYVPTVASAGSLPKEGVFALWLKPAAEIIYLVPPERGNDSGNGGIVTLETIPAGRYRIVMSEEAWLDAVQSNVRLPILSFRRVNDCPGTRQSAQIEVKGEPLTLQFGGARAQRIMVAVLRIWPFEWKW